VCSTEAFRHYMGETWMYTGLELQFIIGFSLGSFESIVGCLFVALSFEYSISTSGPPEYLPAPQKSSLLNLVLRPTSNSIKRVSARMH
jgi:hypothetical protein